MDFLFNPLGQKIVFFPISCLVLVKVYYFAGHRSTFCIFQWQGGCSETVCDKYFVFVDICTRFRLWYYGVFLSNPLMPAQVSQNNLTSKAKFVFVWKLWLMQDIQGFQKEIKLELFKMHFIIILTLCLQLLFIMALLGKDAGLGYEKLLLDFQFGSLLKTLWKKSINQVFPLEIFWKGFFKVLNLKTKHFILPYLPSNP